MNNEPSDTELFTEASTPSFPTTSTTEPMNLQRFETAAIPRSPQDTGNYSEDSESDDDTESYHSFEDSDTEADDDGDEAQAKQDEEKRKAEREARALERQRVLEAAGLILKQDGRKPPPRPVRRKAVIATTPAKSRREPPAPPQVAGSSNTQPEQDQLSVVEDSRRLSRISASSDFSSKELPPVPSLGSPRSPGVGDDASTRLEDAYDRYEAYKASMAENNRWSMASSAEGATASGSGHSTVPPSPSPSSTLQPSRSHDVASRHERSGSDSNLRSYGSSLFHLLGRSKTPVDEGTEKRTMPVISGPILNGEALSPGRENANSPAFGSVSASLEGTMIEPQGN